MRSEITKTADEERVFLEHLRASTQAKHKALEQTSLSVNLLKPDVTIIDYARYLLHMRSVIAYCERVIFPQVTPLLPDISQRYKQPMLMQDLAVLGSYKSLPTVDNYRGTIPPDNMPFSMGYMYVIEGSTLGGRILLNHIKNALNLDGQAGASFFNGYSANTGKLWKEFLKTLGNYAVTEHCSAEITAGSLYAFTSIENYFSTSKS